MAILHSTHRGFVQISAPAKKTKETRLIYSFFMSTCARHTCSAHSGQMGASGPPELESQKTENTGGVRAVYVDAGALQMKKKGGGEGGLGRWLSG